MPKIIDVTELVLRDAHQSLMATRMAMEDMIPACADLDQAGYWSIECWGGATFDSCIRFLNEDPWERLRQFRKLLPNSRLQMLLRGQNLLGYRHYEDTVVDRFVDKAAENGMDVFRVFDALNDIRNLRRAIAAALLKPQAAFDIVNGIKETCGPSVRVHVHVHATTGVTLVSLMKAIEAGADCVDTAISSLSLGPGHNPTESLVEMLDGTGFATRLDKARLIKLKKYFAGIRPRYKEFLSNITGVETEIFDSQIPGGMLSNMESQLKQQGAGDRMDEVLLEVPKVRADAGYPPLVTPSSQIVGTQAVFNVMMGRYKVMTGEFADLMLGYYGETIGPRDPQVVETAEKQMKKSPITVRPADMQEPEWDLLSATAEATEGFNGTEEDVLTSAMFPQVAPSFFKSRPEGPKNVSRDPAEVAAESAAAAGAGGPGSPVRTPIKYSVTVNGTSHSVSVAPA